MAGDDQDRRIVIRSLYGYRTQEPRIQMTCPAADWTVQLDVPAARDIAINLIEACAAAQFDAAVVVFLREDVGIDDEKTLAAVLEKFRHRLEAVTAEHGWLPR